MACTKDCILNKFPIKIDLICGSADSAILSRLLAKFEADVNAKALALIKQISPTAWRRILLNAHYTFHTDGKTIDLDAIIAGLDLE